MSKILTDNYTFTQPIRSGGYTVATLPTGVTGQCTYVTDAQDPGFNGELTGGGNKTLPVFYTGAKWVIAGIDTSLAEYIVNQMASDFVIIAKNNQYVTLGIKDTAIVNSGTSPYHYISLEMDI
jgi:hypothetical protein